MKRINFVLWSCLLLITLGTVSCKQAAYDDKELKDKIGQLEQKVNSLEQLVKAEFEKDAVIKIEAIKNKQGNTTGFKVYLKKGKAFEVNIDVPEPIEPEKPAITKVEEKEDKVIFTLSDGKTIELPKAGKEEEIVETDALTLSVDKAVVKGKEVLVKYTIDGGKGDIIVTAVALVDGWEASINEEQKSVTITQSDDAKKDGMVLVCAVDGESTTSCAAIICKLSNEKKVEKVEIEETFTVEANQTELKVSYKTNSEMKVKIEEGKTWITEKTLRAADEMKEKEVTFTLQKNEVEEARSAKIELIGIYDVVVKSFTITQKGAPKVDPQPDPKPEPPAPAPQPDPEPVPPAPAPSGKLNPLSYMAEHNMKDLENGWDKEHDTTGAYLFKHADALTAYEQPKEIDGRKYHLPTDKEWKAIIPVPDDDWENCLDFTNTEDTRELSDVEVTIAGTDYKMDGKYKASSEQICYAVLSFEDNAGKKSYVVARYQFDSTKLGLSIKMQAVDQESELDNIMKESYWVSATDVVERFLPAAGSANHKGIKSGQGTNGNYWSTRIESTFADQANFDDTSGNTSLKARSNSVSLRLFFN